jgi:hypothetical protein
VTEFNLPLLRKAVEWAESEAAKPVEESEWFQTFYHVAGKEIDRSCGTAYCIAGWTVHEHGQGDVGLSTLTDQQISDAARDLLGIDDGDAWGIICEPGLFDPNNSIEDVREIAESIARKYGEEL